MFKEHTNETTTGLAAATMQSPSSETSITPVVLINLDYLFLATELSSYVVKPEDLPTFLLGTKLQVQHKKNQGSFSDREKRFRPYS